MDCSCDMEFFLVHHVEERRAKKPHRCDDCGGQIAIGERYRYSRGLLDDRWSNTKRCADCEFMVSEVGRTLLEECGGWDCIYEGELPLSWDNLTEGPEPGFAADVRRLVGMQRAICRARGGDRLWSLPSWAEEDPDDV